MFKCYDQLRKCPNGMIKLTMFKLYDQLRKYPNILSN